MLKTDVKIENEEYVAEFQSKFGGNCYRLQHKKSGVELLRTPETEEELLSDMYLYGNPVLFPPNRIRGGEFTFGGRRYAFPVNEPATGCHIHGTLYKTPFAVEERTENSATFVYRAKAGEYLSFPHAFTLRRRYVLQADGLHEWVETTNDSSETMPFMLAFHTTFNVPFLPDSSDRDYRLFMPVGREQVRDERYLPTLEYIGGREREKALSAGSFEICGNAVSALYESAGERAEIRHLPSGRAIVYEGERAYGYRMLWKRAGADFAVIEPQTCAIDCFHLETSAQEKGLISIPPNATVKLHTRFALEEVKTL